MTKNKIETLWIALIFFLFPWVSLAAEPLAKPIDTKNTMVLYISHLFIPVEGSSNLKNGSNDLSINIMQSNTNFDIYHFEEHGKQGNFDLETTSVLLNYVRKIDNLTELKILLPFYYHGAGFMDHYIESFHKAFPDGGLKNGGREFAGDNEIHIQYQTANGGPDINKSFYGIGDPSFFVKRIILQDNPGIALSLGVKPVIGDRAFINSGTTDAGVSLNADYHYKLFYFYAMTGYSLFYGDGIFKEELDQYRDYMFSGAAGCGVTLFNSFYLSVQLYGHSSLYKTGIEKIDYMTIINSYSLRWQTNDQMVIQFSIDEDLITYATADINLSLRCGYTF